MNTWIGEKNVESKENETIAKIVQSRDLTTTTRIILSYVYNMKITECRREPYYYYYYYINTTGSTHCRRFTKVAV